MRYNEYQDEERSILDKDQEAKAILKIAGRELHSDGYRDEAHIDMTEHEK